MKKEDQAKIELLKIQLEKVTGKKVKLKEGACGGMNEKQTGQINEAYVFDFEDWDDTDLNGAGMEIAIDNLIAQVKSIIEKEVNLEAAGTGVNILDAKRQAAAAIRQLWIEKINRDLKF